MKGRGLVGDNRVSFIIRKGIQMLAPSNIKFPAAPSPKLQRMKAAPRVITVART